MKNILGSNPLNNIPEKDIEVLPEDVIENKLKNLNIKPEELEVEIPEFDLLLPGQKVLALENLEQSILGDIKEDSLAEYQSRFSGLTGKGLSALSLRNAAALGKNLWLGITKHYQIAEIEKDKAGRSLSIGIEGHKKMLSELTEGLYNYGPDVEMDKKGKIQINYLRKSNTLSGPGIEFANYFNESATALAQIPDEWRYDTAKESDHQKFLKAEAQYNKDKELAFDVLTKNYNLSEEGAMMEMNKIDGQVRLNQFLNSNPEVETQLLKMRDQSLIKKTLSDVITERGLYMSAGFASRTFATLGLGALGAAVSFGGVVGGAGIIGYFRSLKRAKENIRQKDIMGRRGQKDESETAKNFDLSSGKKIGKVDENIEVSFGLEDKISSLINRISTEGNYNKRLELEKRLKTRLNYTKKRLDDGAVNFGNKEGRLKNQYNLMSIMAQAENWIYPGYTNSDERQDVEDRLEKMLDFHEKELSQERKEYVVKQAFKGAAISMGFAAAGRLFSEFVMGNGSAQNTHEELTTNEPTNIENQDIATSQPETDQIVSEVVDKPIPTGPNSQETVNYLTSDPALKGNLDLKTSLLDQKVTVNVLEKGQSIGTYANVGRDTPVNFVQPNGDVEVHGAGDVYVHPGDRVIQTEDGQIYVIKNSDITRTGVNVEIKPMALKEITLETKAQEFNLAPAAKITLADESKAPVGVFHKIKEFFGGKKISKPTIAQENLAPAPKTFADSIPGWEALPESDQEVYKNFINNCLVYNSKPESAITNFLGQTPAAFSREGSEILVSLKNGHSVVFDTEDGNIIMKVDDDGFDVVSPEKIIATRKIIQSDYSASNDIESASGAVKEEVVDRVNLTRGNLIDVNNELWAARPDIKELPFNHDDFSPEKEALIQNLYDKKLEVLAEIKKQYAEMEVKFKDDPRFPFFQRNVVTFYETNTANAKNIIDGAGDSEKFNFAVDEAIKNIKDPKEEVKEYFSRIATKSKFSEN